MGVESLRRYNTVHDHRELECMYSEKCFIRGLLDGLYIVLCSIHVSHHITLMVNLNLD